MTPPRILLVDDEERFRATLKKLLAVKGLPVETAASGAEALSMIETGAYDVVLLDVKMPDMDGVAALAEIKRRAPGIEVIMLTGHASVDVAVEIMKLGGYDYLLKPCPVEDITEKIDLAFERKTAREEREKRKKAGA